MKKWMKLISAALMMCMVFGLLGNVKAKADGDDDLIKAIYSVKYEGDPVPYGGTISKGDFEVRVFRRIPWTPRQKSGLRL